MTIEPILQLAKIYHQTTKPAAKKEKDRFSSTDGLSISSEAKAALETQKIVSLAKRNAAGSDPVRQRHLEEIKEKLQQGFYNTERIIEEIAERIARSLGVI